MLIFKVSDNTRPIVKLGTLDTVYEQFTSLREQFKSFIFATIYTPEGRLHRSWGRPKPKL